MFGVHMMQCLTDGAKMVYRSTEGAKKGKDISSLNSAENEVLYKRNSSFVVKNVVEKDGKKYILLGEDNE